MTIAGLKSILGFPKFRVVVEKDIESVLFYWIEEFRWTGWKYVYGTYSENENMARVKGIEIVRNYKNYNISYYHAIIGAPIKDMDK